MKKKKIEKIKQNVKNMRQTLTANIQELKILQNQLTKNANEADETNETNEANEANETNETNEANEANEKLFQHSNDEDVKKFLLNFIFLMNQPQKIKNKKRSFEFQNKFTKRDFFEFEYVETDDHQFDEARFKRKRFNDEISRHQGLQGRGQERNRGRGRKKNREKSRERNRDENSDTGEMDGMFHNMLSILEF